MRQKKDLNIYIIYIVISLIVIAFCLALINTPKIEDTNYWVLGNNTVYTDRPVEEIEKLVQNKGLSFETHDSSEKAFFIDSLRYNSIRDMDGLDILINVDSNQIVIKYKTELDSDISEVYKSIITEITENKVIYRPLLSQIKYDETGAIASIECDIEEREIIIKNDGQDDIDIRFLDLPNRSSVRDLRSGSLKLSEYNGEDTGLGVLFKPEAVYAQAVTDLGIEFLDSLSDLKGKIFKDKNNLGIFQFIDFSSVIDTVKQDKTFDSNVESLNVELLESSSNLSDIVIYVERDAEQFSSVIQELLEYCGYRVIVTTDKENCDLQFGYTWIYSNSFQSSLDNTLNETLSNYCIGDEELGTLRFVFRSAWILNE